MIKSGSIQYFELLSLRDRLKSWHLDKLDLICLDKLRLEIDIKIEQIHLEAKERKAESPN